MTNETTTALTTATFFEQRSRKADQEVFPRVLDRNGEPPREGNEL